MHWKSVIAAIVPPVLLGLFYGWIGVIWMFVGRPPSVDYLPSWLKRWDLVVAVPLLFLFPPFAFAVLLICLLLMSLRNWRGPATAFLLSSAAIFVFLVFIDPGEWFRWFLD